MERERRRECPNCQAAYLRFVGKHERENGATEHIYECPNCHARWAIDHAHNPQGKRTAVLSIRRLD